MRTWILGAAALAALLAAGPVHAITVEDVIGLTRAEASDAIIMSKIEADGTVFHLTVEEILALKEAGVSDAVITYMINTGKLDVGSEEQVEEIPDEVAAEETYEEDAGYYSTSLDAQYREAYYTSDVVYSIGFGFYYPYWPGFSWAFYYGPYRYCWRPYYYWGYPYYCGWYGYGYGYDYGWGYGYGYGCGYCGGYTCRSYHHYPYYGHDYARVHDGRNVGNRGNAGGGRVIKGGAAPSPTPGGRAAGTYESRAPRPKMVKNETLKPEVGTNRVVPGSRGSSRSVESPRKVRVIRSTPTPAPVRRTSPGRENRSVNRGPSRQKMTQKQPAAPRTSSSRGNATYRTPSRNNSATQKPGPRTRTVQKPSRTTTQKPSRTKSAQKPARSTSRSSRSYVPSRSSSRSSFSGSRGSSAPSRGSSGAARGGGSSRSGKP